MTLGVFSLSKFGRYEFLQILQKKLGFYRHARAWSFCTPGVIYPVESATIVSEHFLNYDGIEPYDKLLWDLDVQNMLRFKKVGMMTVPNLLTHGSAASTKIPNK